jgi:hypothetical protein
MLTEEKWVKNRWIIATILIYPLLFIWQGLDFTDLGYCLTNYQQIFNDPISISSSFTGAWLTNVIGGLWLACFGKFGLVGVRFASVLIVYITILFAYLTLKPYINKRELLIGLLLALILIQRLYWIHYNNLTAMFLAIGVFLLVQGLREQENKWVFMAGLVLAANIFVRISNILGLSLIICIVFCGYLCGTPWKKQIKTIFIFLFGYLAAIVFILLIMKLMGHYELFLSGFQQLFSMGTSSTSSHGSGALIKLFILDHVEAVILLAVGLITIILSSKGLSWIKSKSDQVYIVLFSGLIVAIAIISVYQSIYYRYAIIMLVGFLYFILLAYILNFYKVANDFRVLTLAAFIVLVITPLGSDNGMGIATNGMWLAIPIGVSYLMSLKDINAVSTQTKRDYFRLGIPQANILICLVLAGFSIFALAGAWQYTYRDSSNRLEMRHTVNHPLLKGVFTTKERAIAVQQFIDQLEYYLKPNDYVLAYEAIPMVHYLTNTRPYLYNSWPMCYEPGDFLNALIRAQKERDSLPVIVRATRSTSDVNWSQNQELRHSLRYDEDRKIMEEFIDKEGYRVVWENDTFQIMQPPEK